MKKRLRFLSVLASATSIVILALIFLLVFQAYDHGEDLALDPYPQEETTEKLHVNEAQAVKIDVESVKNKAMQAGEE